jgi:hypothetical protein
MQEKKRYTFQQYAKEKANRPETTAAWCTQKGCVVFAVQTFIGVGLLIFCGISLYTEEDCNKEAPYWGLIGTLCGFFFRKVASESGTKIVSITKRPCTGNTEQDQLKL